MASKPKLLELRSDVVISLFIYLFIEEDTKLTQLQKLEASNSFPNSNSYL